SLIRHRRRTQFGLETALCGGVAGAPFIFSDLIRKRLAVTIPAVDSVRRRETLVSVYIATDDVVGRNTLTETFDAGCGARSFAAASVPMSARWTLAIAVGWNAGLTARCVCCRAMRQNHRKSDRTRKKSS